MARANFHFGSKIVTPDSTWIRHVQYDPDRSVLEVQTLTGARYRYYDLSTHAFAHFVCSKSMGAHFNAQIKGKYRRRLLPASVAANA